MQVYVAGSTKMMADVRTIQDLVRRAGHEITFDWTGAEGMVRDPTDPGQRWDLVPDAGARISQAEIKACKDADVLILVVPETTPGLGCWIELGAALASGADVWIVGEPRDSVFWQHPKVTRMRDSSDVWAFLTAEP